MGEWMDAQESRSDLSPRTVDHYDKAARHIVEVMADQRLKVLGRSQLERYRDIRLREGASPRLVEQEFKILRMAWKWARDCGHIEFRELPLIHIKINGYVCNRTTPDRYEVDLVIDKLDGEWRRCVEILALTGARPSEVCRLKVSDYNSRRRTLRLNGKTGERFFPVPDKDAHLFEATQASPEDYLLNLGVSAKTEVLRDRLRRACRSAGVQVFTPYGLRRMVVGQMIRSGVDVASAAAVTGHSVKVMLKHYHKVQLDDLARAVARADLGTPTELKKVVEFPATHDNVVTGRGHNQPKYGESGNV